MGMFIKSVFKRLVVTCGGCVVTACASGSFLSVEQSYDDVQRALVQQAERLDRQNLAVEHLSHAQEQLTITLDALALELGHYAHKLQAQNRSSKSSVSKKLVKAPQPVTKQELQPPKVDNKAVLGRVEWAKVAVLGGVFEAEIDTSTINSQLLVRRWEPFERDGQDWVRFELFQGSASAPESSDKPIELPVARWVKSKSNGEASKKKPSISVQIQVGPLLEETTLVLMYVKRRKYAVVLGRHFLRDIALVDVAHKHMYPNPASKTTAVKSSQ